MSGSAVRRWWRAYSDDDGPTSALTLLVLGAATVALGLTDLWGDAPWGGPASELATAWHLVPLALGCAGVALRRRLPVLGLAVAVVAFVGDAAIGGSLATVLVLFDALYAVERFGSARVRGVVRSGVAIATAATFVAGVVDALPTRVVLLLTLQTATLLALPLWWAANVRQKAELAEAAQARADLEAARASAEAERAQAVERAAGAERQAAVRAERSRMARELHDAVAGDVSAVVIRAGAALQTPAGHERDSLVAIRDSGLHALAELRTMIEVLQRDDCEVEPVAPTLTGNGADLLGRSDVVLEGAMPAALPEAVDRAGYRILSEALANAARHGDGRPARVRLAPWDGGLDIEIENGTGAASPATASTSGTIARATSSTTQGLGLGLVSMTERAEALGGAVDAGWDGEPGRRWRVRARLPLGVGTDRVPS